MFYLFCQQCALLLVLSAMCPEQQLASLAKWLSVRLRTKWFWVRVQLQSLICSVVFDYFYVCVDLQFMFIDQKYKY